MSRGDWPRGCPSYDPLPRCIFQTDQRVLQVALVHQAGLTLAAKSSYAPFWTVANADVSCWNTRPSRFRDLVELISDTPEGNRNILPNCLGESCHCYSPSNPCIVARDLRGPFLRSLAGRPAGPCLKRQISNLHQCVSARTGAITMQNYCAEA